MSKKYKNWIPEYLAGYLNESQVEEFEKALQENKELREELEISEKGLEDYAFATSNPGIDLPLSESIWNKIENKNSESENNQVFDFSENAKQLTIGNFLNSKLGIAASVVLLLSFIGNIYFANKSKYYEENFLATLEEKTLIQQHLTELNVESKLFAQEVAFLKNPDMKVCKLISQNKDQNNSLLLAIDMSNDMQVAVMSPDLPSKPSGHFYQLWAISPTGKMVCMGTFDAEKKIYEMKKLPFVPKEFGVTIEEGELGKPQPTSDFLVRGI